MRKMTEAAITIVVLIFIATIAFGTGVYAANNWLSFTGDEPIESTESNINEIMSILERVNNDKLTAEEGLEQLETSYQDLIDKVDELHHIIHERDKTIIELQEQLQQAEADKQYIEHLERELNRANEKVGQLYNSSSEALEEARKYIE